MKQFFGHFDESGQQHSYIADPPGQALTTTSPTPLPSSRMTTASSRLTTARDDDDNDGEEEEEEEEMDRGFISGSVYRCRFFQSVSLSVCLFVLVCLCDYVYVCGLSVCLFVSMVT